MIPDSSPSPRYSRILTQADRAIRQRQGVALAVGVVCLLALWLTDCFDAGRLAEGIPALRQLFRDMIPPDFSRWRRWIRPLLDTVAMSIAGTALATILALPLAVLAAPNVSPHPVLVQLSRILLSLLRAVPEVIMGVIFVAAVGFGTLPGVLALGIHSVGMMGKFFAETIEHVDPKPMEAARAAGCGPLLVILHAVLPQVLPQLADITVYRWEYHFRACVVLGIVGAGGIGFELIAALRLLAYRQVSALLLTILVGVVLVDGLGSRLRQAMK